MLKISPVSSVERLEQSCTDEILGVSSEEARGMRTECKALPIKSKNTSWCGDRRKWAEHRLMPGFDCMSKLCCHRDCIQCSRAQIDACPMSLPFHSSLPVSFIYLLCLLVLTSKLMEEQHRSATLLNCYTVTAPQRHPTTQVSDWGGSFSHKSDATQCIYATLRPVHFCRTQNTTKPKSHMYIVQATLILYGVMFILWHFQFKSHAHWCVWLSPTTVSKEIKWVITFLWPLEFYWIMYKFSD